MVYVKRKEHFNAAHRLFNPNWSKEKNEEVFGPCANENWHGHNFELIITVKGVPNKDTGFVIDMKRLSDLVKEKIIQKVDHRNFNLDVDFMEGVMPSCENIIMKFWEILAPEITKMAPNAVLHKLKLYETPRNAVEYFG